MGFEYMSQSRDLLIGADGYEVVVTQTLRKLIVQITGDDQLTWKLQGSLDGSRWYDVENESGAPTTAVNAAPQSFTVDKYSKCRLWASNSGSSLVVSLKGIAN